MTSLEIFKRNVARRLDDLGWTYNVLATKAKMPPSNISEIFGKNAKRSPSLMLVDRIAQALQTTPSALLDAHEPPPKPHLPADCIKVAIRTLRGLSESSLDSFLDEYLKP